MLDAGELDVQTNYDACSSYVSYWNFGYSGTLTQTLVIPSDHHITSLTFKYQLDFIDPHHDGAWNRFESRVTDTTAGVILGWETRSGSNPDLACSNRSLSLTSATDLAGHTIQVRFSGSVAYTDTYIRVKSVQLLR